MNMPREPLANRRVAETFHFEHVHPTGKTSPFTATLGFYPDGRLGEIFLYAGKVGTEIDVAIKDAAILLSFALQHGCDAATMRAAMTRSSDGQPEGVIGTLLDLIVGGR